MARHRYILELHRANERPLVFELPLVSDYTVTDGPESSLEWTLGEEPIIERSGVREVPISLQGSSGHGRRLGSTATGGTTVADGDSLFREFRDFLALCAATMAADDAVVSVEGANGNDEPPVESTADASGKTLPGFEDGVLSADEDQASRTIAGQPRVVFRALHEGDHWRVDLGKLEIRRAASANPFLSSWSLPMRGYKREEEGPETQPFARAAAARRQVLRFFGTAEAGIERTRTYREDAGEFEALFLSPLEGVANVAKAAQRLATDPGLSLQDLPLDAINALASAATAALAAGFAIWESLPVTDREASTAAHVAAMGEITAMRATADAAIGAVWIRTSSLGSSATTTTTTTQRFALDGPVVRYQPGEGESLLDIAAKVLGSRGAWTQLAALNETSSPFFLGDGTPIGPGVTVLVPVGGVSALSTVDARELFGVDLLVVEGDLVASNDLDDVRTVAGDALYEQAIDLRLRSERGESRIFPRWGTWGVGELLDEVQALAWPYQIADQVRRDPRTATVAEPRPLATGASLDVELQVVTVAGGRVQVYL